MDRAERSSSGRVAAVPGGQSSASLFTFQVEYRTQCSLSGAVRYKHSTSALLGLDIPLAAAVNLHDVNAYQEREQKRQKLREEQADAYIGSEVRSSTCCITELPRHCCSHLIYCTVAVMLNIDT